MSGCSSSQCSFFEGCVDKGSCPAIIPDSICCDIARAREVVDALFNPIATLKLFYQRAIQFLKLFVIDNAATFELAGIIAGVAMFIYIASWIGSLVAFVNIFI